MSDVYAELRKEIENKTKARSCKAPMEYSYAETGKKDFDRSILEFLRGTTTSCAEIKDSVSLKIRILEHIHVCSLLGFSLSLRYLNQKFGLVAHRLGINTRHIIDDFVESNKIMSISLMGKTGYFCTDTWIVERAINSLKPTDRIIGDDQKMESIILNMIGQRC